jgi:hypothetical protein
VLLKAEGETRLKNLWNAITTLAAPMYGDARILQGYHLTGTQIAATAQSEPHPLCGGWRGLPKRLGLAFAVGSPYLAHWPEVKSSIADGDVAVRSVATWARGEEITETCGTAPDILCAPEAGRIASYWPFEMKPALNR